MTWSFLLHSSEPFKWLICLMTRWEIVWKYGNNSKFGSSYMHMQQLHASCEERRKNGGNKTKNKIYMLSDCLLQLGAKDSRLSTSSSIIFTKAIWFEATVSPFSSNDFTTSLCMDRFGGTPLAILFIDYEGVLCRSNTGGDYVLRPVLPPKWLQYMRHWG